MKRELPSNHPSVSDTAQPCPYLEGFPGESNAVIRSLGPANQGKVPNALFYAVLLSVVAVALVIPTLPKVTEELGGSSLHIGLVGTLYGLSQLIGSNFLGPASDSRGRKGVLLLSFLGGAAGYFMIYVAMAYESLSLLLMSRIPVGIFMQTMTMARSIVSDCSNASSRARALAKNAGVPAGLGFIVGPMVGGILSSKMPLIPPLLATFLFCVAFVLSYFTIPETAPVKRMTEKMMMTEKQNQTDKMSVTSMIVRLLYHHVFASKLFLARGVVMLAYLMMQSSFHVFAYRRMNLETRSIGLVLTYVEYERVAGSPHMIG